MTDKEFRYAKDRISKYAKAWIKHAGFGWWKIDLHFSRTVYEDNKDAAATTDARWRYNAADITFYIPVMAELSDQEIEDIVVHELCHIPMSGMVFPDNDQAQAIFEKAVDDYARHLVWTRDNAKKITGI